MFRHGPVTITVEGLPESVLPAAMHLELGVHYSYHSDGVMEEAFCEDFAALGGSRLFPGANGDNRFSVKHLARGVAEGGGGVGSTSKLQLYAPARRGQGTDTSPAIVAALECEWIERTADGAASALREAGS
jgi:hypothetical protein